MQRSSKRRRIVFAIISLTEHRMSHSESITTMNTTRTIPHLPFTGVFLRISCTRIAKKKTAFGEINDGRGYLNFKLFCLLA